MASGKLLILIGDECKNQKKYFGLDKEYEFEVLFGVESDTGDVLGLISKSKGSNPYPKQGRPEAIRVHLRVPRLRGRGRR